MVAHLNMPNGLRWSFRLLDGGMLVYWAVAALGAAQLIHLPASFMYGGYGTPIVDAWNWSFAPLDIIFSILGLVALRLEAAGKPMWRPFAMLSLALTFCAGLMAVSFWSLTGYYNLSWWLPNLLLMLIPIWWIPQLLKDKL